ncbi:hypothetical protein F5X68DRAFT_160411 [Plectosphaerella plurivora]|uniref:Hydroxyproline-rich glyco protein n=1 Tax=Plectosphaerella plurivora TaxID=936078 RepID=A0A9P8V2C7_9PEZI|nr:hypothetical protein F5X68DRAFT_160411 [Plectosphaerella plurivora]
MEESAPGQDGDTPDLPSNKQTDVVNVSESGDVVLNVKFLASADTVRAARRAYQAAIRKPGAPKIAEPNLKPEFHVAYRVDLAVLRQHSKYFDNLLGNTQFAEAKLVEETLAGIRDMKLGPAEVDASSLPWISITDDDEATKSIGREKAFEDMLRILHGRPVKTGASNISMLHVITMAILSDRFDCQALVSRYLAHKLKFKWPMTSNRPLKADGSHASLATEQVLRQKILASWLLEQPLRLQHSTREIIIRGSSRWSALVPVEDLDKSEVWWDLPDGLEGELQYRREAILNTIASIQRHFLALYSSRERQCQLGYDSSSACDSFQLGQMLKFFTSKDLVALVDFGPSSLETLPDSSTLDLEDLLAALRQCPNYQIDKNHTNCGLRTRLEPIVEYVQTMLSSAVVAVSYAEWKKNRAACSWLEAAELRAEGSLDGQGTFRFTRGLVTDQRLRYEGALYADKLSRALFTAEAWDWSPEY